MIILGNAHRIVSCSDRGSTSYSRLVREHGGGSWNRDHHTTVRVRSQLPGQSISTGSRLALAASTPTCRCLSSPFCHNSHPCTHTNLTPLPPSFSTPPHSQGTDCAQMAQFLVGRRLHDRAARIRWRRLAGSARDGWCGGGHCGTRCKQYERGCRSTNPPLVDASVHDEMKQGAST
jgi:hypothetical protein